MSNSGSFSREILRASSALRYFDDISDNARWGWISYGVPKKYLSTEENKPKGKQNEMKCKQKEMKCQQKEMKCQQNQQDGKQKVFSCLWGHYLTTRFCFVRRVDAISRPDHLSPRETASDIGIIDRTLSNGGLYPVWCPTVPCLIGLLGRPFRRDNCPKL